MIKSRLNFLKKSQSRKNKMILSMNKSKILKLGSKTQYGSSCLTAKYTRDIDAFRFNRSQSVTSCQEGFLRTQLVIVILAG